MLEMRKNETKKFKFGQELILVKNHIVMKELSSGYKYCIGELNNGILKGYILLDNSILSIYSLSESERIAYDNIAINRFYMQNQKIALMA